VADEGCDEALVVAGVGFVKKQPHLQQHTKRQD
jgi:hypothetical protein